MDMRRVSTEMTGVSVWYEYFMVTAFGCLRLHNTPYICIRALRCREDAPPRGREGALPQAAATAPSSTSRPIARRKYQSTTKARMSPSMPAKASGEGAGRPADQKKRRRAGG